MFKFFSIIRYNDYKIIWINNFILIGVCVDIYIYIYTYFISFKLNYTSYENTYLYFDICVEHILKS